LGIATSCYIFLKLVEGNYSYRFHGKNSDNSSISYPWSEHLSIYIAPGKDPIVNHPPSLYGVNVDPDEPTNGDIVEFGVYYRDLDDDAPVVVYLEMYDENMTPMQGYNLTSISADYYHGVYYHVNVTMYTGSYHYWFSTLYYNSSSRKYEKVTTDNTSITVRDPFTYPSLYNHSVYPPSKIAGTPINFSVHYFDPFEGREDPDVKLFMWHSDGPDSTIYTYNMTRNGNSYSAGVVYYTNLNLQAGNYSYNYGYWVYNGTFMYPLHSNLTLYVAPVIRDHPPVLFRENVSISGTNVTFSVHYKDPDGDSPHSVYVNFIDKNRPNVSLAMHNMTMRGSSFDTGIVATVVVSLKPGTYHYRFETTSKGTSGWSSASLPVNFTSYLTVTVRSIQPTNSAPVLYSPSVSPARPVAGNLVNFSINYRDADGDSPSHVKLFITTGSRLVSHKMTIQRGNFTNGVGSYISLNLSSGTYSYHFQTGSGSHTVTYPSRGTLSLTVQTSGGGGNNRRVNGTAMFSLDPETGDVKIDTVEVEEGLYLELQGFDDGVVSIKITSEEIKNRLVSFEIDEDVLDIEGEFVLFLDGKRIGSITLEEIYAYQGDEPQYHLEFKDGKYVVHMFIPDATVHDVEASIKGEDDSEESAYWILIVAMIAVVIVIAVVVVLILSKAQERKKKEDFYKDFDLDLEESGEEMGVLRGSLDEKNDWDDLLE
jgi:hypothetical protein